MAPKAALQPFLATQSSQRPPQATPKEQPMRIWHSFDNLKPPLGSTVLVQTAPWWPFPITITAEEHCPGHGQGYPCYLEVPGYGLVHISQFLWSPIGGPDGATDR